MNEGGEGVAGLLLPSDDRAHQDALSLSAGPGSVPSPDFAIDDGGADGLFGSPIESLDCQLGNFSFMKSASHGIRPRQAVAVCVLAISICGHYLIMRPSTAVVRFNNGGLRVSST